MPESDEELGPEDEKLVVLARSARARAQAAEGAAVRDSDGRTYAACSVRLTSFSLTAMQAAVAAAVSSGVEELEAAAVVTDEPELSQASINAAHDLGSSRAPIYRASPAGTVHEVVR